MKTITSKSLKFKLRNSCIIKMGALKVLCLILFSQLSFYSKAQNQNKDKPNILFILTDDQTYSTIHALGNKEIVTPNIDNLVKSGFTFTQAHLMGSMDGAVCMPSRAMILSSKNIFHLHKDGQYIPTTDIAFPELFKQHGYTTFETGKWHQDYASFNRCFTEAENILFAGMNPPQTGGQYRPKLQHYDATGKYDKPFWGDHFSSVYFADAAINFLGKQHNTNKPFLMYVAFSSPHDPRTAPSWYGHSYAPDEVSLPANFLPKHPFDNGELDIRDEMLLPTPRPTSLVKREIAKYYAMVSEVDAQIGRVINALKKSGKYDNTIIVFASDNGLAVGQHGLLGKQNPYDCAIRIPLVFAGKGIPQNKISTAYIYLNDIYPTICQLAGLPIPKSVEGISLVDAFKTPKEYKGRNSLFFAYSNLQRAIIKDSIKYITYNVKGQHKEQLFDLHKDPLEKNNLVNTSTYTSQKSVLIQLLKNTMKEQNDFCDIDKKDWGHAKKLSWNDALNLNP